MLWPYKLIADRKRGTLELCDLERDPRERQMLRDDAIAGWLMRTRDVPPIEAAPSQ